MMLQMASGSSFTTLSLLNFLSNHLALGLEKIVFNKNKFSFFTF